MFYALFGLEGLLYIAYMAMDLAGMEGSSYVKYAAVLLLALSSLKDCRKQISIALFLAAAADIFLLLLNRYYPLGICIFTVAQLFLRADMEKENINGRRTSKTMQITSIVVLFLYGLAGVVPLPIDRTTRFAILYITLFSVNLYKSIKIAGSEKSKPAYFFAIGMFLFFLCDLSVGLHNLQGLPQQLASIVNLSMWGFYIPGLSLIRAAGSFAREA